MKTGLLFAFMSLFLFTAYAQSIKVKIETSKGTMVAVLYDETPIHRDNFVKLAESGFYEGLLFHRVINTFMIQGGRSGIKKCSFNKTIRQWRPRIYFAG